MVCPPRSASKTAAGGDTAFIQHGERVAAQRSVLRLGTGDMTPLSINITATNDEIVESDEDFRIDLSNPTGSSLSAASQVITTIVDDDLPPIATDNLNSVTEDVTLTATGNMVTDDDGFGVDFVDSDAVDDQLSMVGTVQRRSSNRDTSD